VSEPLVAFRRIGGRWPPEREMLEVDADGDARLWRSIGHVVGRFAGPVPNFAELRDLVKTAENADPPTPAAVPPDAPVEELEAGGRKFHFEEGVDPDGPWGKLANTCRRLMTTLMDKQLAVIRIESHGVGSIRLEHAGSGKLTVELDEAKATLELWRDGKVASQAEAGPLGGGRVEAGPDWSLEIDVPGIDATGGGRLTSRVTFVADDEGVFVPMSVSAPPVDI
jgi:hypothetical protein